MLFERKGSHVKVGEEAASIKNEKKEFLVTTQQQLEAAAKITQVLQQEAEASEVELKVQMEPFSLKQKQHYLS